MRLLSPSFFFIYFISVLSCASCLKEVPSSLSDTIPINNISLFDSLPTSVYVMPTVPEASGVADSKKNLGYVWVQEDSGNPPELSLLNYSGIMTKKLFIKGVVNRDWEDIVLSGNTIYVGDIGDNNAAYPSYSFYTFSEPDLSVDTITNIETIQFQYSDGPHDAEAFLVDPTTHAIYIITKRDIPSRLYKLSFPFSLTQVNTAQYLGSIKYNGIVSAALSTDNKQVILKTYFGLNYYSKAATDKIEDVLLNNTPIAIPYIIEPQGEAVCFSQNSGGYFTISEIASNVKQVLSFYKKK